MKPQSAQRNEQITLNKKSMPRQKTYISGCFLCELKKGFEENIKINKARARSQRGESKKTIKPLLLNG